jgi:hypothetical protein
MKRKLIAERMLAFAAAAGMLIFAVPLAHAMGGGAGGFVFFVNPVQRSDSPLSDGSRRDNACPAGADCQAPASRPNVGGQANSASSERTGSQNQSTPAATSR